MKTEDFNTQERLEAFNEGWQRHIMECLKAGWNEKASVDYEGLLSNLK